MKNENNLPYWNLLYRKVKHGDCDTMREVKEEYERQQKSMQKLTDQAQKLELGYGERNN